MTDEHIGNSSAEQSRETKASALEAFFRFADSDELVDLINEGADVKDKDEDGRTLLHYANESIINAQVVRAAIEHGAEVDARDIYGKTPLHYAALGGNLEAVKELLDNGADVNAQDKHGHTPLHDAVAAAGKEA